MDSKKPAIEEALESGSRDDGFSVTAVEHCETVKQNHHDHVHGNAFLVQKDGQVRKVPVPSSDPNDPLNFRRWEKYGVVFCCCWFSIMGLSLASGLGAILNTLFELYGPQGYGSEQVVFLITLPTLCIGLGNYIILPLSLAFGRRPVFLVSMVILFAAIIWSAVQNSYGGHLASRVIQGLATGCSESLLPLILTEVTFIHERSRIFGLYWMTQNVLSSTMNLSSSYINDDLGWRWYYWIFAITVGLGIVFAYLLGLETQFSRPAASLDGQIVFTDEFGVTRIIPDSEAQEYLSRAEDEGLGAPNMKPDAEATQTTLKRKSYLERIRFFSPVQPKPLRIIALSWLHMAQGVTSPGILYAILSSSITLGASVGISLTYNAVLMQSYHWEAKDIGLINIGGIIGAFLGMLYCTFIGGRFLLWFARRNNGIHKPEDHLIVMVVPAIVGVGMLLLYGLTADGSATWWGPYIGWTLFQFSFTSALITSTAFASEAAPTHPGPTLVVVVGTKNIISFGITYGLTPMVERHGYQWAFGVLAGIYGAIFLLGIPVYFINPRWRAYSARQETKKRTAGTD